MGLGETVQAVQFEISDFGFEMLDLSDFTISCSDSIAGRSTRFHHITAPVANKITGENPITNQSVLTGHPAKRPKCKRAIQARRSSPQRHPLYSTPGCR